MVSGADEEIDLSEVLVVNGDFGRYTAQVTGFFAPMIIEG